jgi:hypothetical protein
MTPWCNKAQVYYSIAGTVVEHSPRQHKIKGLSPAAAVYSWREELGISRVYSLKFFLQVEMVYRICPSHLVLYCINICIAHSTSINTAKAWVDGATTFTIMTLSRRTLSIMTLNLITLSITTLNITSTTMTLNIMNGTKHNDTKHNDTKHNDNKHNDS